MSDAITEHFSWSEFRSHDGKAVPWYRKSAVQRLCRNTLEVLRAEHGHYPIRVLSGWRSKAHNTAVGGAPRSYHLRGRAADAVVEDLVRFYWLAHEAMIGGLIPRGGLAYYPATPRRIAFVHIDDRGVIARWRPGPEPRPDFAAP